MILALSCLGMQGAASSVAAPADEGEHAPVAAAPAADMDEAAEFVSGTDAGDPEAVAEPDPLREVDLGTPSDDPFRAMIDDIVRDPTAARRPGEAARPSLDDDGPATLFYDQAELKQRVSALKERFAWLTGDDAPQEASEEERELRLQRAIAMKGAYDGSKLAGGWGTTAADAAAQAERAKEEKTAQLRLLEFLFLLWDTVTHPLSITLAILYGLGRLIAAIVRRVPKKRHRSRHRRTVPHAMAAMPAATETVHDTERAQEPARTRSGGRRHSSRRRRGKRGFLEFLRSI